MTQYLFLIFLLILGNSIKATELSTSNQLDSFETKRLVVHRENYEEFRSKWLYTNEWPIITLNPIDIDNIESIDTDIISPSLFVGYSKDKTQFPSPIVVYALGLPHILQSKFSEHLSLIKQAIDCFDIWYFEESMEVHPNYRGQGYLNELRSYIIQNYIDPFLKNQKFSKDNRLFAGIASYALNTSSAQASFKLNFSLCQVRPSETGCYLLYTSNFFKNFICFPKSYQKVANKIIQLLSHSKKKDDAFCKELNEIHQFIILCFKYQQGTIHAHSFKFLPLLSVPLLTSITTQLRKLPYFKDCVYLLSDKRTSTK